MTPAPSNSSQSAPDVAGKPTPAQCAPWTARVVGESKGRDVYDVMDTRGYALCGSFFKDEAFLVAAAPDLLEALQAAIPALEYSEDGESGWNERRRIRERAQAAIAKATGAA